MASPEELAKEFGFTGVSSGNAAKQESLAREFGYDPDYKEPPVEDKSFWQSLQDDPTLLGALKRTGVGVLRGGKNILDTGAEALAKSTSYVADKILPEELAAPIRKSAEQTIKDNAIARHLYDKEYPSSYNSAPDTKLSDLITNRVKPDNILPTMSDVGVMMGEVGATLPVIPMRAISAINSGLGALPTITAAGQKIAAPLLNRLAAASATGATGGAILGAAKSSYSQDKSLAENVGENVIGGAIGGPLIAGAAQAGKSLASGIVGKITPARAALAERAEQLGINLKATQVSDSPFLKKYDQVSGWFPFSGSQDINANVIGQFNKAVSRTFGKDVEDITPSVVKQGLRDIGDNMNTLKQNVTVDAGTKLQSDLITIIHDAANNLQESEVKPIFNNLRQIAQMVDPNTHTMSGDIFHNITKHGGLLSKLQDNSNPNISKAANQIREKLEEALQRSMTPQQLAEWRKLKLQYKSGKTVQELIENDPDGKVSALKLMRKVSQSPGGKLGSGELGELADIGREFFKLPNDSGTPLGNFFVDKIAPSIHSPITAISAGAASWASGAPLLSLVEGGFGLGVNRAVRESVNSKTVKQAIIRAGKGSTYGNTNALSQIVEPYSSKLLENKKSSKETLKLPTALEN